MMEVEKVSKGPMETNIDPRWQEEESTAGPIEELVEIPMDPMEPSRVLKVGKGLSNKLSQKLVDFLRENQDVFAWTHANMVGIHLKIMCHRLNIYPHAKPLHQK